MAKTIRDALASAGVPVVDRGSQNSDDDDLDQALRDELERRIAAG